tara:strand:+ start:203 stop:442 length:240 start_codon:yes stop_codon:yes gene_type:complete
MKNTEDKQWLKFYKDKVKTLQKIINDLKLESVKRQKRNNYYLDELSWSLDCDKGCMDSVELKKEITDLLNKFKIEENEK